MKIFIFLALVACTAAFRLPPTHKQVKPVWEIEPRNFDNSDKIVGGSNAYAGDYPFVVSVEKFISGYYTHICGGAIIKSNRILTAAHCTHGVHSDLIYIVGGQITLDSDTDDHEQLSSLDSIVEHPSYNHYNKDYDFAVLRLREHFSYNSYCISVRDMGSASTGETVHVVGWGETSEGGPTSNTLRKLTVPMLSDSDCRKAYPNQIYDSMMCAGYMTKTGLDSCYGDSGGPLTKGAGSDAILVGIVSWGDGCARYGKPGVYGRVSKISSWARGI